MRSKSKLTPAKSIEIEIPNSSEASNNVPEISNQEDTVQSGILGWHAQMTDIIFFTQPRRTSNS